MGFLDGVGDVVDDASDAVTDTGGDVVGGTSDVFGDIADWEESTREDRYHLYDTVAFGFLPGGREPTLSKAAGDATDAATNVPSDVFGGIFDELSESPIVVLAIVLIAGYILVNSGVDRSRA